MKLDPYLMQRACSSEGKASVYNAGDLGLIPGSGRSPGEGNGNPLQYSNSKWIKDLNVRPETIKLLGKKNGKSSLMVTLDMTTKSKIKK